MDEIVSVLPIHYSDILSPNIHVHQFPLLNRPLQAPPSAAASGKYIKARLKPKAHRLEIHVPLDTRPEVRNLERSIRLGTARLEDDKDKNQEGTDKLKEGEEARLSEVRLKSEEIPQRATYVLGVIKNGKLHLHPISETHQLRPTLTYLDVLSRKSKRRASESDTESDDGPPPDPDVPVPPPSKKEKKPAGEAKEVHVTARKADDSPNLSQGGVSAVRRDMLHHIRQEEEEIWENIDFYDVATQQSSITLDSLLSSDEEQLACTTNLASFLTSIRVP